LQTPENWMIGDTTPILNMLDERYPQRRMFPTGKRGVLVNIVEEFFDEWIARTMVHYRWHYPDSARFASEQMVRGNNPDLDEATRLAMQEQITNWGGRACRATGTDSTIQQQAAEEEYERILVSMEQQLGESRYLLGDRPCAVDCIVLGSLRAHTWNDPDPKKLVANFPRVIDWCENRTDHWDGTGDLASFPEGTGFSRFILNEAVTTYKPFAMNNADALAHNAKAFNAMIYGEEVSYLTREYPERSRQMIIERINNRLSASDKEAVITWLSEVSLLDCFAP
jgi:glutathione S-transferase